MAIFAKGAGGFLVPADSEAEAIVFKLKPGEAITGKFTKSRNIAFHRKFFALMNLAFNHWDVAEKEYKGRPITKNVDRFREEVLILAGHYEAVYNISGTGFKLVAKSISFAKCDELEFEKLYQSVLNVLWDNIFRLSGYRSEDEVKEIVSKMLHF